MALTLEPFTAAHLDDFLALSCDPSLAAEFEILQDRDTAGDMLADPFVRPSLCRLAIENGAAVGFSFGFVLPSWQGDWAVLRIGVLAERRRRGIGTVLLESGREVLRTEAAGCGELCLSAWIPNAAASGFAAARGFAHARFFWLMERPRGDAAPPVWPDGIEVRAFDGSPEAIADWSQVYNDSFAEHYHGVVSTLEACAALAARSSFRRDSLLLAYRDGACVAFCRDEIYPHRGEIGALGVARAARGIGLGRAMLRWGVDWLERDGSPRVTLMVDGDNETALSLYRSEGFATVSTREIWSRPLP